MILERKLQELGRIRIGDQVEIGGQRGKKRPHRLDTFRLTSVNKPRLEYAARLWGGVVSPWEDAPTERMWQLYTEQNALPVSVPPFNAISQYNEIWQGNECRIRCDGDCILHSSLHPENVGTPCQCQAIPLHERLERAKDGRACQTITRVSLILPDLPGFGVWRLDTHSFYAGMELQGCVDMMQSLSMEGIYIECTMQVEQRKVVRRVDGKTQTRIFPVVILQPNVSMRQLVTKDIPSSALIGGAAHVPMIESPAALSTPPVTREEIIAKGEQAAVDLFGHVVEPSQEPRPLGSFMAADDDISEEEG